ncbi:phosphatase PAP2 family protein [Deinococcus sp. KSM4-11]|uniref:phosphatase PAP2 family protein n=1 Tax=Deinococcus sp. KSM4-11 TaxID=2568654 RepID=UPI0010A41478|nr:phosphatase PAP2 family protein [Deinococcus sp. KSM4-11]THF88316.1 phosphatase PAP2 family protein [Deinococcus sp. KSM4-11]
MTAQIRSVFFPLLRLHWRLVLLVLLGVLLPLILVAHFTDEIFREGGYRWDQAILAWYAAHRTPALTRIARDLAVIGGVGVLPVITVIVAALIAKYRSHAHAWFLVLALAGATLINVLAKVAFQRPRPDQLVAVLIEPGYSFPSGHTMANAAFGIALGLVFWKSRWGWPVMVLGVAWAVLIGVSRNYLGVHYPTDVMVGFLFSVAWVVGLYLVVRRRWTVLATPVPPASPAQTTSAEGN